METTTADAMVAFQRWCCSAGEGEAGAELVHDAAGARDEDPVGKRLDGSRDYVSRHCRGLLLVLLEIFGCGFGIKAIPKHARIGKECCRVPPAFLERGGDRSVGIVPSSFLSVAHGGFLSLDRTHECAPKGESSVLAAYTQLSYALSMKLLRDRFKTIKKLLHHVCDCFVFDNERDRMLLCVGKDADLVVIEIKLGGEVVLRREKLGHPKIFLVILFSLL